MITYETRLRTKYQKEVVPSLLKEFGYKSSMQVPRLLKIAINQGLGEAVGDKKIVESGWTMDEFVQVGKKISKDTDRDFIMTSSETVEYGIIDEVMVPNQNKMK